ncbi:MAG TPA: ABC transporter substrate-binding protein [Methylomirabilota bacterium]|jgi:branched-chain amino acid transport system substrate-binding protein|nr:ABC transporter substrate-binding protein [Methylomirabilota bacterium]
MRALPRIPTLTLAVVLAIAPSGLAQGPIKIGEINSYSGVGAAFTAPYRAALEMALDEINARGGVLGRKIEVVFRDDKLRPDEGIKHAQELVFQEKVDFLMGTFSSAVGLAVSDFAKKNKIVFLAAEPLTEALTWEKGHRYAFRVRPHTWAQGRMLADRAAKLPYSRWANIGPDYEYGHKAWEGFWNRLKELKPGLTEVSSSFPKLGAGQYLDHINKLVAANPEAVYTSLFGGDWIAFVKQATPFGLFAGERKKFVVGILLGEPEYIDPLGKDAPDGMLVTGYPWYGIDTPAHKAFVERYGRFVSQKHPSLAKYPYQGSLVGYITMISMAEAIRKAGTTDAENVVKAMEGLKVDTPTGPITFRASDHQSTMGAWVGTTRFDPQRGVAVMADWEYVPGEKILPTDEEVKRLRPGN